MSAKEDGGGLGQQQAALGGYGRHRYREQLFDPRPRRGIGAGDRPGFIDIALELESVEHHLVPLGQQQISRIERKRPAYLAGKEGGSVRAYGEREHGLHRNDRAVLGEEGRALHAATLNKEGPPGQRGTPRPIPLRAGPNGEGDRRPSPYFAPSGSSEPPASFRSPSGSRLPPSSGRCLPLGSRELPSFSQRRIIWCQRKDKMVWLFTNPAAGPAVGRAGAAVPRAVRLRSRKRNDATVRRRAERVIGEISLTAVAHRAGLAAGHRPSLNPVPPAPLTAPSPPWPPGGRGQGACLYFAPLGSSVLPPSSKNPLGSRLPPSLVRGLVVCGFPSGSRELPDFSQRRIICFQKKDKL